MEFSVLRNTPEIKTLRRLIPSQGFFPCLSPGDWWGARGPVDLGFAPVLVPSGHRLAPTEPAGETRSGAETEPVSSDTESRAHRVRKLLAHRARDRQSGVLAFILWSLISPWQVGEYRPAFFVFEPSDQPLFSAVLLTTMISSIVTSNISARITKLSIVGNAVPWNHL